MFSTSVMLLLLFVHIDDHEYEIVDKLCYLGDMLQQNCTVECTVREVGKV